MAKGDKALIQQAYDAIYNYLMNVSETKESYNTLWEKNQRLDNGWFRPADGDLFNLLFDLRDNLRYAKAKENGNGNLHKVIESLIKHQDDSRPAIVGIYEHENGYTYYTNSWVLFKTKEKLDLPHVDLKYNTPLDYERIVKPLDPAHMREVHVPNTAELKQYAKENKYNAEAKDGNTLVYFIKNDDGKNLCAFNIKYLTQCREGIGDDAKCYVAMGTKSRITPLVMVTENTTALVVPMRPSKGWESDSWEEE